MTTAGFVQVHPSFRWRRAPSETFGRCTFKIFSHPRSFFAESALFVVESKPHNLPRRRACLHSHSVAVRLSKPVNTSAPPPFLAFFRMFYPCYNLRCSRAIFVSSLEGTISPPSFGNQSYRVCSSVAKPVIHRIMWSPSPTSLLVSFRRTLTLCIPAADSGSSLLSSSAAQRKKGWQRQGASAQRLRATLQRNIFDQ